MAKARRADPAASAADALRAAFLRYPGAHLKSPWPGHLDLAVKDKTFAYLSAPGEPFSLSAKLPRSGSAALMLPGAKPTPYGLGKSGWVSIQWPSADPIPLELFHEWIDESYRAQAPKRLVAELDGRASTGAPVTPKKPAAKKPAAKKPAAKKPAAKKPAAKKPAAKRAASTSR